MGAVRFRIYLGTIFFGLSTVLLSIVFGTLFFTLQGAIFQETVDRLRATVTLGAQALPEKDLQELVNQIPDLPLTEAQARTMEETRAYKNIYQALNRIRLTNQKLIRYVYILIPTADPTKARFVVDADVLRLREEAARTGTPNPGISGYGRFYDITSQPMTQAALMDKSTRVEERFIRDEEYQTTSMMGMAPIFDGANRYLGTLGIDISDQNYNDFLGKIFWFALFATVVLLALIVTASIFMARRISRPLSELAQAVHDFGKSGDYSSRVVLKTVVKEIFQLKENFNVMAASVEQAHQDLQSTNQAMQRFVPEEILTFLSKKSVSEVALGDQIQKDMAVLFTDIRGFTGLSEALTPKQTFGFLNDYLARVSPPIRKHNGFVDKYMGDGLMAVFPGQVDDAVAAALDMRRELERFNQEREAQGLPALRTGTGIHMGPMILGTVGEAQRMQTTVISDSVNLASRLESLTKELGTPILISKEVFDRLAAPERFLIRLIGSIRVRGKLEDTTVLEVFDQDPASLRETKARTKLDFEKAVRLLQNSHFEEAEKLLTQVTAQGVQDLAAQRYLDLARNRQNLDFRWTGKPGALEEKPPRTKTKKS